MDPYKLLFEDYVAELTATKHQAEAWWASLLEAETRRSKDRAAAEASLSQRWPLGPPSHPRVIAVYRKYYRACTALTNELEALAEVKCEEEGWDEDDEALQTEQTATFLIDYLCDASDELGHFILHLVFLPIAREDEDVRAADLDQPETIQRLLRAVVEAHEGRP